MGEKDMQECTFRPDLTKSKSSFRKTSASVSTSATPAEDERPGRATRNTSRSGCEEESHFVPCTNAVPDTMGNARAYLARDVFARLSAPILPEEEIDTSSRLARSRSDSGLLDQVSSEFLRRQEVFEEERRERLGLLQFIMEPPHAPLLSNRSRQLAEKRRQRHPSEVSRRPRRDAVQHDPECSFRPAISADAAVRRARSIDELSTGDRKRQEARTAKLRAEVQAESLKEATFTPQLFSDSIWLLDRLTLPASWSPVFILYHSDDCSLQYVHECALDFPHTAGVGRCRGILTRPLSFFLSWFNSHPAALA